MPTVLPGLAVAVFLLSAGRNPCPGRAGGAAGYFVPPVVTIYLSFDDGPCKGSEEVDRLATVDSVPVNVFVIGKYVFSSDSMNLLFRRYERNPMIEIGNHSFTHANKKYRKYYEDAGEVLADFNVNRDSLHLVNGIARLPGRNFWRIGKRRQEDIVNGKEAADSLAAQGYRVFGWDLEWRSDSLGLSVHSGREMLELVDKTVREERTFRAANIVILLHDPQLQNAEFLAELRDFIRRVREKSNYRFGHLSAYPDPEFPVGLAAKPLILTSR